MAYRAFFLFAGTLGWLEVARVLGDQELEAAIWAFARETGQRL